MAGPTMTLISTQTIASGTASTISFTSIPQTYTDLILLASVRDDRGFDQGPMLIGINGAGYTNGARRQMLGTGTSVNSSGQTGNDGWFGYINESTSTANVFSSATVYIPNYATSLAKLYSSDVVQEANGATAYQTLYGGSFGSTAAITSLQIGAFQTSAFVQYSTFSLYGVLSGSGGATVS
jgi:hypothetical protein